MTNPGVGSGNIFAQVQSRFFSIEANAILNLYRADPGAGAQGRRLDRRFPPALHRQPAGDVG